MIDKELHEQIVKKT